MKNRKRSSISGPFVPILKEMIKSPAFGQLTNASRVTYLLLKSQCCRFDQNEVKFPFSDAEKFMHRHTFRDSITQLIELGFIEKSFIGGMFRRTNIYKFIEGWKGKDILPGNSIRGYNNSTVGEVKNRTNKV